MIKLRVRSLQTPTLETEVVVDPIQAIEYIGLTSNKFEIIMMEINGILVNHLKILSQLVF